MATINYKTIFDDIVNKIESYPSHSFNNIDRANWVDTEKEVPVSYADGSFCVLFTSVGDDTNLVSDADSMLNVKVEFLLNSHNNNYVQNLGFCQEAVLQLKYITGDYFSIDKVRADFTVEPAAKMLRIIFDNIKFVIPNY